VDFSERFLKILSQNKKCGKACCFSIAQKTLRSLRLRREKISRRERGERKVLLNCL
jgi:hypothetical protein